MKKLRNVVLGITSIATVAALVSCGGNDTKKGNISASETRTVLAQEGISALNTIDMMKVTPNKKNNSSSINMSEITSIIDKANVLAENKLEITISESDRAGYLEKQTLSYGDNEYFLYITSKIQDTDDDDDDDDEDEIEEETKYEGIIVDGENEYPFVAKQELEVEDDEVESEFKMTVTLDDYTTVIIEQENEVEDNETETKFSCKYKTNGKTTEAYCVKTEVENGEKKIKVTENNTTYKLKYYTKNNVEYLKVKEEGSYEIILSITLDEDGNTVYSVVEND